MQHRYHAGMPRQLLPALLLLLSGLPALAAESFTELTPSNEPLNTRQFAGDWHVIASIPVRVPFFSDADAYNYVQSIDVLADNRIVLRGKFNRADNNDKLREYSFKGFLINPASNAEWKIQYLWPFRSTYLVNYFDADYQTAIIGIPGYRWGWVLTRQPNPAESVVTDLMQRVADAGYDTAEFRRIPQR